MLDGCDYWRPTLEPRENIGPKRPSILGLLGKERTGRASGQDLKDWMPLHLTLERVERGIRVEAKRVAAPASLLHERAQRQGTLHGGHLDRANRLHLHALGERGRATRTKV